MLLDFDHGGRIVRSVPYQPQFQEWKKRLNKTNPAFVPAIEGYIDGMISRGPVHTTSWMPGSDWTFTPLQPIYEYATKEHVVEAAKCFGLFVMERVLKRAMEREETWGSGHYEKDGYPIKGRTYFRLDVSPSEVVQ